MGENRKEVDELLVAYAEYKRLLEVHAGLSAKRAKQKMSGSVDPELEGRYQRTKADLQEVADSMTFSNPLVWIMYKFEAYKSEAQPICTMRDLRLHCSKDGYVCTKRFAFLNEHLILRGWPPLSAPEHYNDSVVLEDFLKEGYLLQRLVSDPEFLSAWQRHEYNHNGTQVAKWESYSATV